MIKGETLPGSPVVNILGFSLQGAQVPSLDGELKLHAALQPKNREKIENKKI